MGSEPLLLLWEQLGTSTDVPGSAMLPTLSIRSTLHGHTGP